MTTGTDTRSLDAQLAEALGWTFYEQSISHMGKWGWQDPRMQDYHIAPPCYSTNGSAMLDLVSEMRELGWELSQAGHFFGTSYRAVFRNEKWPRYPAIRQTLPKAIATAALAALTETKT